MRRLAALFLMAFLMASGLAIALAATPASSQPDPPAQPPQPAVRADGCPNIVSEVMDGVIEVDSGFRGARVIVYGAIQNSTLRRQKVSDVVITLRGPNQPIDVRRKELHFGFWAPGA